MEFFKSKSPTSITIEESLQQNVYLPDLYTNMLYNFRKQGT